MIGLDHADYVDDKLVVTRTGFWQLPEGLQGMESHKYCVYNQTRESFLSLELIAADVTIEKLKRLIESLAVKMDSSLWIMPYRGMPSALGHFPVDLIYLDENYHVIQEIESFPASVIETFEDEAASALVLPAHTIFSSQTQLGDQLVICAAEEMEHRLERLTHSSATELVMCPEGSVSSMEVHLGSGTSRQSISQQRPGGVQTLFQESDGMNQFDPNTGRPNSLKLWLRNWLSSDRRRAHRKPLPGLVAYYWTGSTPRAYQIADISIAGLYLLTEDRWFPGTMVLMTLQRTDSLGNNLDDAIAVQGKVVRWDNEGLGLSFILSRGPEDNNGEIMMDRGTDKKTLERFLRRLNQSEMASSILAS
ncbi:MAG: PilZ domain-containing protein [Acidobacteriota bacterium]|nr:PilZ domain-containing protein [Acidobacteriota bacterium]